MKCRGLSGGTKRKLCTAVAFMGDPQLILMDEPTSGMDALTKRLVWAQIQHKIFNSQKKNKVSIILTSHSMEECEVLCSRLAIMVDGKFHCLGTPTHIKQKFGRGYTVSLLFKNETDMERGRIWVTEDGPFSDYHENISSHNTTLSFKVFSSIFSGKPNIFNSPSIIFSNILEQKRRLRIQDFSVKHTTLDEVFVGFAKSKTEGETKTNVQSFREKKVFSKQKSLQSNNHFASEIDHISTLSTSSIVTKSNRKNNCLQADSGISSYIYNKVLQCSGYLQIK